MKTETQVKHTPWIEAIEHRSAGAHWEDSTYVFQVRDAEKGILGIFPKRENAVSFIKGLAAPELLQAAKELLDYPGFNAQAFGGAVPVANLLKAIAKAEGQ